ncbi:MAG: hypothetical protein MUF87_08125 [Anaerolineae bacterium]|jgi:hypothetical protein|nr:hypothetical protein [Anaerolineae bacterium]
MGLMQSIEFSQDDLKHNQRGELSEMQHYRLRLQRRRTEIIGALIVLVVVVIASGFIYVGNLDESPILILIGVGLSICSAAFTGIFARYWLKLTADINGKRVMINSGELERVIKPINRRVITYLIRVNQAEVVVSKEVFKAFQHGATYHIYRAPYSGVLLAAELIEQV